MTPRASTRRAARFSSSDSSFASAAMTSGSGPLGAAGAAASAGAASLGASAGAPSAGAASAAASVAGASPAGAWVAGVSATVASAIGASAAGASAARASAGVASTGAASAAAGGLAGWAADALERDVRRCLADLSSVALNWVIVIMRRALPHLLPSGDRCGSEIDRSGPIHAAPGPRARYSSSFASKSAVRGFTTRTPSSSAPPRGPSVSSTRAPSRWAVARAWACQRSRP